MGLAEELRLLALYNARAHGGMTREGAVLGKILGSHPELRSDIGSISGMVAVAVSEVNAMSAAEQEAEISKHPEIERKKPAEREGLPELEGAVRGQVVTRFPPEPNGYPHIGHAKAAIISSEYARMYGGRFILRFDDTNPEAERMEYHAAIKVGLEWLGIKPDAIKSTSDDMKILYEKGTELVKSGMAYVCTCKRDDISRNRRERVACRCSEADASRGAREWDKMMARSKPGSAVLRFRGDIKSDNSVMRDPVLFRIIEAKHYTRGQKYRVWPSYDMAVAIEDSIDGITHAFRSKEFELRAELTGAILGALGMREPRQGFFSRLEFRGMPTSKRVIRPLIEEGKVSWYDDPRLPTLEALKRRGIRPEAVRRFVMSLGLTKADTLAPFDALESFNRSVIDPVSRRLFMVEDPVRIDVEGIPPSVDIPNHPSSNMGSRTVQTGGGLYIPGADARGLERGSNITLMGIGGAAITGTGDRLRAELGGDGGARMQWVARGSAHRLKIVIPGELFRDGEFDGGSLSELDVYTEPEYLELDDGAPIQFVRFGYCRKDSRGQAIFTHK